MRRIRRLLAPAAIAAALLVAAAPASADLLWAKPQTLAAGFPGTVAIDARGDVLVVWQRVVSGNNLRTFYAWRPPRGDWTAAREIDAPRVYGLALALSPLGRATIAWNDGGGRIVSAEARPGGAFGDEQVLASGVREALVDVEVDDAGNAVAAWLFDTETGRMNAGASIFVATRRPGGEWSEPQDVSGDVAGGGPFVAINAAGAAAVAWTSVVGGKPELAYRQPAGRFARGEPTPLTGPTYPLHLTLDDAGRAFLSAGANAFTNDPFRTQVATRSPLGEWGERFEFPNGGIVETMLADPKGVLTFLMTESTKGGEQSRVQYATLAPNGSVTGPVTLAEDRSSIEGATNLRGDVLAVWHGWPGPARVEASDRLLGGVFTPPVPISSEPGFEPEVAMNDARQAAVVWAAGGYTDPRFQVAVREDPSLPPLPFPPGLDIDVPALPVLDPDGDLAVPVECTTSCVAGAEGVLDPGGDAAPLAGDGPKRRLRAKRRGRLKLDFGSDGRAAVRKALKAGRKPVVYLSVRARGKSPRPITASRRVRLR